MEIQDQIRKGNHFIDPGDMSHHDLEANDNELTSIAFTGITLLAIGLTLAGSVVYFLWSAVDYLI